MPIPKRIRKDIANKEFADGYVDEFLNMSIATQLKVLREQRRFTQKKLADLASMKQERISVLESVNYSSWSLNTLRKLASALDVVLRVSFETFGSRLSEMGNFTRESLERTSREDELKLDEKLESVERFAYYNQSHSPERDIVNQEYAAIQSIPIPGTTVPGGQTPAINPIQVN